MRTVGKGVCPWVYDTLDRGHLALPAACGSGESRSALICTEFEVKGRVEAAIGSEVLDIYG
jgi:hypothetical protein